MDFGVSPRARVFHRLEIRQPVWQRLGTAECRQDMLIVDGDVPLSVDITTSDNLEIFDVTKTPSLDLFPDFSAVDGVPSAPVGCRVAVCSVSEDPTRGRYHHLAPILHHSR